MLFIHSVLIKCFLAWLKLLMYQDASVPPLQLLVKLQSAKFKLNYYKYLTYNLGHNQTYRRYSLVLNQIYRARSGKKLLLFFLLMLMTLLKIRYVVLSNARAAHVERRGVCYVPPIKLICKLSSSMVSYWLRYSMIVGRF